MRTFLILTYCALASISNAAPSTKTYAQELVDRMIEKYPDVLVMAMHVTPPKQKGNIIIASNIGRIGKAADADDLRVIRTGAPNLAVNKSGDRFEAELVMHDANSRPIGALGIVFAYKPGEDKIALQKRAESIRDDLAKKISHVANLLEPAQFDTAVPTHTYAQALVDRALARHPRVVILALHAQPSQVKSNVIVASNIGRIGKKADEDDMHVITSGETKLELNETGDRYEVEQTLLDVSGSVIGAIGVVFPYQKGQDATPLQKEAAQVRDEISRRISNVDNLVQPDPFDPKYRSDTEAQKLLDASLESHRDVLIMAMHVAAPDGSGYVIAASNIGRIGKKADEDDLSVINTGKPNTEVNEAGNRFEVEIPMMDTSRRKIGALSVVYPYKNGADKAALQRNAESIRDELAARIPSNQALFAPPSGT
ncbi:MAG: hypothetical protein M3O26_01435 [Pseudomonadota bacterium]|nr:hypothetical protein [Pseudomonadota bacterium]